MATLTGNNGSVIVNGVTVAAVRSFSVEITSDTIEKTTMGTDTRQYLKGLSSWSASADIYFDPAEFAASETVFDPTAGVVGDSPVAVKFYIEASPSGTDSVFTGTAIVTGYTVNSSMDGMVEASISLQGNGNVSFGQGVGL